MKFTILLTLLRKITFIATLLASVSVYSSDLSLPSYTKVNGISGSISSVGSDTLSNIMTYWAEMFRYEYPS
ncbi:MAG: phosphate-binding protein, partial [Psychromonas sp.]